MKSKKDLKFKVILVYVIMIGWALVFCLLNSEAGIEMIKAIADALIPIINNL